MNENTDKLNKAGQVKGMAMCGPSTEQCKCNCPDSCEHDFDGPMKMVKLPSGATLGTVVCQRCGMSAYQHSLWVSP